MLIRDAEIDCGEVLDLRVAGGRIAAIGKGLRAGDGEAVVLAEGAALLPGLRDHHLHLAALAAAADSVPCGPPQVGDAAGLERLLRQHASVDGGWLRGIGYHESVAGEIDRDWLDRCIDTRPVRIQHRGGRLWILNSRALQALQVDDDGDDPLERSGGRLTGRLYEGDRWLRQRLGPSRPDLAAVSLHLASLGVTGVTDTGPHNTPEQLGWLRQAQLRGELRQDLLLMGDASFDGHAFKAGPGEGEAGLPSLAVGAHKFHLLESQLPEFDGVVAAIRRSHHAGRNVAFHCVTRAELVFALGALDEAGSRPGDRIEHAAVTPPELLQELRRLGLAVVTQPGFVAERGDAYREQVEAADWPWLYRLKAFLDAGVPLAGSSDAPFGEAHPWKAMQAAVERRSRGGCVVGADEALSPERALRLFTSSLRAPGGRQCALQPGAAADLCLLDRPWAAVRSRLAEASVRMTFRAGTVIWAQSGDPGGADRP
ncbi:MAG: amidohydrolase family protein [Nevskia sp.]|nr:amidohydrolase family protein [Nevskia sp.]